MLQACGPELAPRHLQGIKQHLDDSNHLTGVIQECVKTHLGSLGLPLRAMLLIDNCPAHPPDLTVDTADGVIESRFLPANTTSHFQTMDQGPLEVMKRHYRRHLIQNLVIDPAVPVNDAIKAVTLKDTISFH